METLKPCPRCHDAWIYASVGDYGSGYENHGYRVNCRCGYAWALVDWSKTKETAVQEWNRRVDNG